MEPRAEDQHWVDYLAGRPGAFDALVARYGPDLFGFLYRYVGDAALAEDLAQETLLQIHVSAASFDRSRPFKPWMYTIAANKARDFMRSRGRRREQSLDFGSEDADAPPAAAIVPSSEPGAVERADEDERREVVRGLIALMPEHLRLILVLGYYQQLPYAEISEILGIPVGTVKSRLHAAVTNFAKLWHARAETSPSGGG
ncbi:MAG: RNA polymerase sigma factor [Phycisphaerales bacterium]|nr:RNA polymerase sigma factor [Phycisphaerales bacterium]